ITMVHIKNKKQRARKEVSEILKDVQEQEIVNQLKHGKPVDQLVDEQLFTISKKPDVVPRSTRELKKLEARNKITYVQKLLSPNVNVDPIAKDVVGSAPKLPEMKLLKRLTKTVIRKKNINNVDDNMEDDDSFLDDDLKQKKDNKLRRKKFDDIWHNADKPVVVEEPHFVKDEVKVQIFAPPKHKALVKDAKALELPKAGLSYNPDKAEHQTVIQDAVAIELYAQKYVDKIRKGFEVEQIKYPKTVHSDDDKEDDDEDEEGQLNAMNERVTRKEKNKRRRRAEDNKRQMAKLQLKKQSKELDRSADMAAEIAKNEELIAARRVERTKTEKLKEGLTKKVGKYVIATETEPVLLADELPKSLKNLNNPQFNPLMDRYKSLQKRNIVEASGPKGEKKEAWKKVYTRNSYHNSNP
ncbi:hypothetical protein SAMD00019534_071580, partial [Acytostelium subglobosum LB1]|uniref:hypothetical protein n=1 Tax=Acytostelium subglobosum LB1 TaxID=1410327 RepID=UPI000644E457